MRMIHIKEEKKPYDNELKILRFYKDIKLIKYLFFIKSFTFQYSLSASN